jgi:hypothetical protein
VRYCERSLSFSTIKEPREPEFSGFVSQSALMTKFLAILGLLALALTGGVATISTLISPP